MPTSRAGEVSWASLACAGDPPSPRSGHSINVVHGIAVVFGGCGVESREGPTVYNETWSLHLRHDPPRWHKLDALGDVPDARWRHTGTVLPDGQSVLVFGGLCRGRRYNDTCVLHVKRREWTTKDCAGTPPHARSHHTATLIDPDASQDLGVPGGQVLVCGGFGGPSPSYRDFLMDVHLLAVESWSWTRVEELRGTQPVPRSDHAACIANGRLFVLGGRTWTTKTCSGFLDDMQVLDLKTMRWLEAPAHGRDSIRPGSDPPPPVAEASAAAAAAARDTGDAADEEAAPAWPGLGSPRWNHSAVLIDSVPWPYLFVFGGQRSERHFSSDLRCLQVRADGGRWFAPPTASVPPEAREDCGFAYDPATSSVILVGGWRQKWLADAWQLNVAGIVGPPYAASHLEPDSGPVTGSAPVRLFGLRFRPAEEIQLRFSDGRHEAFVPGDFVSDTCIAACTPVLDKMVPGAVTVSVALGGQPFTVNRCAYRPFLNSRGAKSVSFGPGVGPEATVGVEHVFLLQTKDATGANRTSGGDRVHVRMEGRRGLAGLDVATTVEDMGDGRYRVAYTPPAAGAYAVHVRIDEVAFGGVQAVEASRTPVRGSPFAIEASEAWLRLRAPGVWPRTRAHMRACALPGGRLLVLAISDVDAAAQAAAKGVAGAREEDMVEETAGEEREGASARATPTEAATPPSGIAATAAAAACTATGAAAAPDGPVADAELEDWLPGQPSDAFVLHLTAGPAVDGIHGAWVHVTDASAVSALIDEARNARAERVAAVRSLCLPPALERALLLPESPNAAAASLAAPGAPPDAPSPDARTGFDVAVRAGALVVHGGWGADGLHRDEVWVLTQTWNGPPPAPVAAPPAASPAGVPAWRWERVYGGSLSSPDNGRQLCALAATSTDTIGGTQATSPEGLVPTPPADLTAPSAPAAERLCVVELRCGPLGDSLEVARVLDVTALQWRDDFASALSLRAGANLGWLEEEVWKAHGALLRQLPGAADGHLAADAPVDDPTAVRRVLRAMYDLRTQGEVLDLTLDQLRESFAHLQRSVADAQAGGAIAAAAAVDGSGLAARGAAGPAAASCGVASAVAAGADRLHPLPSPGAAAAAASKQAARVEAAAERWAAAKKAAPAVRKAVKHLVEAEAAAAADRVRCLEARAAAWPAEFLASGVAQLETGADAAYSKCDGAHTTLAALEGDLAAAGDLAEICDLAEAAERARTAAADARAFLGLVKAVWDLTAAVQATIGAWESTRWTDVDTAAMEEEARQLTKAVRALDKRAKALPVWSALEALVKRFSLALPCVGDLKSPSMRERHWRQLAKITDQEIPWPFPEEYALGQLLALQLHKFVDDVGEVVDRAVKEDKMEQQLARLGRVWAAIDFKFDPHRDTGDGSGVVLVGMRDEDFDMLEENQLLVQGMMASKYLATFEEEVIAWQRKLSVVSDVLSLTTEVQRRWAHLETLFVHSDEVRTELPEDAERFRGIDAKFKEVIEGIHAEKNAVRASHVRPNLLADLADMSANLELCEKSLADFLEAKKRLFPRFYFVATAMLLDILSNGNRPAVVAKHVNSLLQGVKRLELAEDLNSAADAATAAEREQSLSPAAVRVSVTALESNEGERLPLNLTGSLALDGRVEVYLNSLIAKVRRELHAQLRAAIDDLRSSGRPRTAWLFDHCAQLVLVTTQVEWTEATDRAFQRLGAGEAVAMKTFSDDQIRLLSDLIKLVQGKLDKLQRRKIMNLITLETHSRDINLMLVADEVRSGDHFKWASQLKTRWMSLGSTSSGSVGRAQGQGGDDAADGMDCHIFNCDARFAYSYEYLGCASRLVITPLTDRIYTTATQACHLVLGCAPAGPAGTGKTETTKDLSAQLGKAVYVVNCGPEMDYRTMGDIFKGLASAGAWGCFDEFNRLLAEVLSVCSTQYKAVLDAIRQQAVTYRMEGVDYSLHPDGCMAFITMNPGYLGRTELPESLKVLFRPVTVMVPDMQMIMENMLMAEGYTTANTLAKKFFTLYRLLKDLLSPQLHYDWGLRAIKSVLVVAGGFKRGEPDQDEGGLLMRALRDFNLPKIVDDDMVVFLGLLRDLWPDVFDAMPRKRDHGFETLVTSVAQESNLQASEYFVQNVVDLQDLLDIRHSVFELGSSGNNKTKTWQTLAKVWTKGGVRGKTTFRDINPKAITPNELYGFVNMATREWKDGLLSSTMRDMANAPDTNPKWIILDGDLDANWIENMNSVMDDNRLLTLASNERIRLLPHMRLIFEIRDLAYASPATVTRAGILFISEMAQWKNFVASWIDARKAMEPASVSTAAREERAAKLQDLFATYCEPTLAEIHRSFKPVVPLLDFNMAQTLCYLLEGLLTEENVGLGADSFEIWFVYAAVWAFGSSFTVSSGVDFRKRFSIWWKDTWRAVRFPHRGEVFDYYVDPKRGEFAPWAEIVPQISYSSVTPMSAVTVPTGETVAVTSWLDNLMARKHPAMLVGNAGCGKTAIINGKLRALGEDYMSSTVNINYYTNSSLFQRVLEAPLEKKAGKNYGPPGSKKLVYFVDDLNMAALDKYNTASNISLMRQHLAYGHVYDMHKLTHKVLLNTQYLAAMNPTAGSFVVNPRLQRLFTTFALGFPGAEALTTIYQTFLGGHLQAGGFGPEVTEAEMGKRLVQAALQLHRRVNAAFRKTASNFHYEFNIRHMAGVFQGILMGTAEHVSDPLRLAQLWLHESERVYGDRLVSPADLKKYKELAGEVARKVFKEMSPTALMAEPLLFTHFATGLGERAYARVNSFVDLSALLDQALRDYNEANAAMHLVLFEDAMRHVCRVSRIIESPGGHALLVGVGGSGKQSLSKLAAFVSGFTIARVVISASYGVNELKADLQSMYRRAGLKAEDVVFLFTDQQVADERFLVFVNDLLASGHIPGLFPPEDVDEIASVMRPKVKRAGLPDTRESAWGLFIDQVKANLHAVLCFSPVGEPIKVRVRRFPALVNCVTIDWFQPWPEEALASVSRRFLAGLDLGGEVAAAAVTAFMPFSFLEVNKLSRDFAESERRFNWTTPKSFLELIALYKEMLARRRSESSDRTSRLSNGVTKLEATAADVSVLGDELTVKQVEVEDKKQKCEELIPRLEQEKSRASDEMQGAAEIASEASAKQEAVREMKHRIDRDLADAEPVLEKAAAALDSLNKKDLGELKSLAKPPAGIDDVTGACVYLLHDGSKGKVDASWKASQQMMKDVNKFLEELLSFKERIDKGSVPKHNFRNIRPLLEKEWFNVDTMRTKSAAAAGLCDWVLNITVYWDINENVEPMRQAAHQAEVDLAAAIKAKDDALDAADRAKETVAILTAQYEEAVAEKEVVIREAAACERKLGLAQRLMAALGSEGERWRNGILALEAEQGLLPGNVLLAAAFVSYSGCFNRAFREELLEGRLRPFLAGTLPAAKGVAIPMAPFADPVRILTDEAEVARWASEGLPTDRVSVENGAIVTKCARWPLLIDPQLQGVSWIKRHEEARGLHVGRLGQKSLMPRLETSLAGGFPLVIENIQTTIDAVLAPVISRQLTRRGRSTFVKLGDKEVGVHADFRLYLQTKLSNPHYPPEIQAECTLINFTVTEDGLEDQLLALTVSKERPDLEEGKRSLISQLNGFKVKTKELEDGILEGLATAEGDVVENLALIENLEDSKRIALEIADKVKVAEATEAEINSARELYRRVAARGSLMFFILASLNRVHSFHHYSLSAFISVFERAVTGRRGKLVWHEGAVMSAIAPAKLKHALRAEAAEAQQEAFRSDPSMLEARLAHLEESITFETFAYARRGLFERHKLILATQLLLTVMRRAGELVPAEADFLVRGHRAAAPPHMTARAQEYLTPAQWAGACALREVEPFRTLPEDLELATDAWREWVDAERPEEVALPGEWGRRLVPFQRVLLLRALRADRVTTAVSRFVEERLGTRYVQQDAFRLEEAFHDSGRAAPLFFVLFPGVDPGEAIAGLGRRLGFTEAAGNLVSISMGQGQEKHAENTLDRFADTGGWVFLQNIHLMQSWLPDLERKLEMAADTGHEDFRAFLSAEPPPLPDMQTVPEGILQAAVKVANEPPTDLRATLRSSWALFDQRTLDASTRPWAHAPMLFSLAFFHALVLGRRKFGSQGFSRNYPFNNGDLTVCAAVLHNYLEAAPSMEVPWEDVRYILGEIMYGGHITDAWDRRVTTTYLQVLLAPELVDEKGDFELTRGFRPLLEGTFAAFRAYAERELPPESPALFGLHPNAEIGLLIGVCDELFEAVQGLGGGGGGGTESGGGGSDGSTEGGDGGGSSSGRGGGGDSREAAVRRLLQDFQDRMPDSFNMGDVKARAKERTPYLVCVLQELERMNVCLDLISRELGELDLGLSGALNISDSMDTLMTSLHANKVPPLWLKVCGQIGPTGSYNRKALGGWFADLLLRHQQLKDWAEDPEMLPPCVWLSGLFNPMGYITACLQVTARAKCLPLDSMAIATEVLPIYANEVEAQPEEGTFVHGLFMEGARWDVELNSVDDSRPKELFPVMPTIHVRGVTAGDLVEVAKDTEGVASTYVCPVYSTRIRGPTFTFAAPLRTLKPPHAWVLAGVCLVMQAD